MPYVVRKKNSNLYVQQDESSTWGDLQTAFVYPNLGMIEEEGAFDDRDEEIVEVNLSVIEPKSKEPPCPT